MANDRLLLVCRCGQAVSIYKYYPQGGFIGGGYETSEQRQDWIDTHINDCNPVKPTGSLNGSVPFSLATENAIGPGAWRDGILYLEKAT